MDVLKKSGCNECNLAVLSGMSAPLENVATESEGPIFLYRCRKCGCLWIETLREAHPISKEDAKNVFTSTMWEV